MLVNVERIENRSSLRSGHFVLLIESLLVVEFCLRISFQLRERVSELMLIDLLDRVEQYNWRVLDYLNVFRSFLSCNELPVSSDALEPCIKGVKQLKRCRVAQFPRRQSALERTR